MVSDFTLTNNGPGSISSLRHWMQGFALQTLVYGINIVLFAMTIWVLAIHILKALARTHKFHRLHLLQNYSLTVYTIVMFALASLFMGRQGLMADGAWHSVFRGEEIKGVEVNIFHSHAAICNAVLVVINWGTVGILLWRCMIYWKVCSVFPLRVMAFPYLVFALSMATSLLSLLQEITPSSLSNDVRNKDWRLISWSISTALYYLLSLLISARNIYRRRAMKREIGEGVYVFLGGLTIFNESGIILLIFATAYLVALARFPNLIYLFQALVTQIQVMTSLIIVQRVTGGRAWSGKTVDCVLLRQDHPSKQEAGKEEVSTIGFNPNSQDDYESGDTQFDKTQHNQGHHHHDVTLELRAAGDKT